MKHTCLVGVMLLATTLLPMSISAEEGNSPPVAISGGPYVGEEGSPVLFDASDSYDPDNDPLEYNWDLDGDGMEDFIRLWFSDSTISTTWFDDYSGEMSAYVRDPSWEVDIDTTTVVIYNVDPLITSLILPEEPVRVNEEITLLATFIDPGIYDTHTAEIDWGDGISEGFIEEEDGSGTVYDSHSYSAPGVYTVSLTVTDDDGGSDTMIYRYIVVFDPEEGFITGGGWIDSPEGAYPADATLTGKATFGFIAKYKKGQSTPTGNTEFQFHVAGLTFHSVSYEWLVITSHKAMYKGIGTINGDGCYGFMISVVDEALTSSTDVDQFRMKIWDTNNDDEIVYDNNIGADDADIPSTALDGGQIVIHKR